MTAIDEIKSRIDIVDLAAEAGVKLRRSGKNYTGFCPFHDNKRTPAFVVWPDSGTWRCFGECNEGGDIFKFIMKKEGLDFKEALQRLADKAGVTLERFQAERPQQKEENLRLRDLLEDAVQFFRHHLLNTAEGKTALDYLLEKRHLTRETIETWGLGYAPPGYDNARNHFLAKGYSEQELMDAGLVSAREEENQPGKRRIFDRFHHRIMIPIRDENGKMCGFGARIHPNDPNKDQAKFINTSETPIFTKGHLLYGLDRARKPIRATDQAVIVEGYLDVIAVHQAGFENVVSPMGTALTEEQLRLLKRFTRKIVLALDPDTAGQKAILRGLEAARASMDRAAEHAFDARGLLRHEARLQADLRVAALPDELDPDEVVARSPAEWEKIIASARPVVEHVLDTLIAAWDGKDPKGKSQIVGQMLPLIDDLPDPVERDSYIQLLARRLRLDERSLAGRMPPVSRPAQRPRPTARPASQPQKSPTPQALPLARKLEAACLALLLPRPDLLPRLDRRLQQAGLLALSAADFEYTDHQLLLRLVQSALEQDEAEMPNFVRAHLPADLTASYTALAAARPAKAQDDSLLNELTRLTLWRRRQLLSEAINQLRFLQEDASPGEAEQIAAYHQQASEYQHLLVLLDKAK